MTAYWLLTFDGEHGPLGSCFLVADSAADAFIEALSLELVPAGYLDAKSMLVEAELPDGLAGRLIPPDENYKLGFA